MGFSKTGGYGIKPWQGRIAHVPKPTKKGSPKNFERTFSVNKQTVFIYASPVSTLTYDLPSRFF